MPAATNPKWEKLAKLFYALESKHAPEKDPKHPVETDGDEVSIGNAIFWQKFAAAIEKGLSEVTLKDLLDEAHRLKKGKQRLPASTFHI